MRTVGDRSDHRVFARAASSALFAIICATAGCGVNGQAGGTSWQSTPPMAAATGQTTAAGTASRQRTDAMLAASLRLVEVMKRMNAAGRGGNGAIVETSFNTHGDVPGLSPPLAAGQTCIMIGTGFQIDCREDGSAFLSICGRTGRPLGSARFRMAEMEMLAAMTAQGEDPQFAAIQRVLERSVADKLTVSSVLADCPEAVSTGIASSSNDAERSCLIAFATQWLHEALNVEGRCRSGGFSAKAHLTDKGASVLRKALGLPTTQPGA